MHNRQSPQLDLEQSLKILYACQSEGSVRQVMKNIHQNHGKDGVNRIIRAIENNSAAAKAEAKVVKAMLDIVTETDAKHPNNPAKQMQEGRKALSHLFFQIESPATDSTSSDNNTTPGLNNR
jgi:hypothetical protein